MAPEDSWFQLGCRGTPSHSERSNVCNCMNAQQVEVPNSRPSKGRPIELPLDTRDTFWQSWQRPEWLGRTAALVRAPSADQRTLLIEFFTVSCFVFMMFEIAV